MNTLDLELASDYNLVGRYLNIYEETLASRLSLQFRTPSDVCRVRWCPASAPACFHKSRVSPSLQQQQLSVPSRTARQRCCRAAGRPPCWCCCGTAWPCLWPSHPAWPEGRSAGCQEAPTLTPSSLSRTHTTAGSAAWTLDEGGEEYYSLLSHTERFTVNIQYINKLVGQRLEKVTDPSWAGCRLWLLWRSRCKSPSLCRSENRKISEISHQQPECLLQLLVPSCFWYLHWLHLSNLNKSLQLRSVQDCSKL